MEQGPAKNRIQLLSQALSAAASSINLAKQLINEIEREGGAVEPPGLIGKYDGNFMVTEAGKKYPVPDNYAAKTLLVYGDKLKMVEGPTGRRFKHIGKTPRVEAEATLTVKDGRFVAVTSEVSYKLIQSWVSHLGGEEGDKVKILIPKEEKHVPFAALVGVRGKGKGAGEGKKEGKKEEKKEKKEAKRPTTRKAASKKKGAKEAKKEAGAKKEGGGKGGKKAKAKPKKAITKKTPSKKGEAVVEPLGEEELR